MRSPILWYRRGRRAVTLTFVDDALNIIDFADPDWPANGGGWDDYDYDLDVESYYEGKARLDERLGKPGKRSERSKHALRST